MPGRWWISQNLRLFVSSSSSSEWQCDNVMIMTCDFTWFGKKKLSFPKFPSLCVSPPKRDQSLFIRDLSNRSFRSRSKNDWSKGWPNATTNIDNEYTHGTNSLSKSYNSQNICLLYVPSIWDFLCTTWVVSPFNTPSPEWCYNSLWCLHNALPSVAQVSLPQLPLVKRRDLKDAAQLPQIEDVVKP